MITEALWTKSPSCSLQEPSLPDGFLHSSPENWPLLWCCCHLKAVLWRFLKFRCRMGCTYTPGKVQVQQQSSCFRELPSQCTRWLQGWEVTGSHGQVRAPKSTDERLRSPKAGSKCHLSRFKWLPTPGRSVNRNLGLQRNHRSSLTTAVRLRLITSVRLRIHHEVMMDKPLPSYKKFQNVILEEAGLHTLTPQQLVQQSNL